MTTSRQILPARSVVFLLPAEGQIIGLFGVVEAFDAANRVAHRWGREPLYRLQVVGVEAETATVAGPLVRTVPAHTVDAAHTVVVGGGLDQPLDTRWSAAVGRLTQLADRVVAVCMGTFALGPHGWLEGRRCTTHWLELDRLRREHPRALVEDDALYTEDGPVFTSAGATAGIDLALHLIRLDGGERLALAVAKLLVVFAHRPGGQSQFGSAARLRPGVEERVRALVDAVNAEPAGDHRVEVLASRVGMSPRNFARVFRKQTGQTPAQFVGRIRVEAVQRALAHSDAPLAVVASDCGFASTDSMRRTFRRVCGVSPSDYRARFGASTAFRSARSSG